MWPEARRPKLTGMEELAPLGQTVRFFLLSPKLQKCENTERSQKEGGLQGRTVGTQDGCAEGGTVGTSMEGRTPAVE